MNYSEALNAVNNGQKSRRSSWKEQRHIRKSSEGDKDFLDFPDLDKVIIDDCPKRECDCVVCIYQATADDMLATDWEILKN